MKSLIKCMLVLWLVGCSSSPVLKLKSIDYADLPDWEHDNTVEAYDALQKSCGVITTRYQPDLKDNISAWKTVCRKFESVPKDEVSLRIFIEDNFVPYSVKFKGKDEGIITGYYEASLRGSHSRHGEYQYPIYGVPNNSVIENGVVKKVGFFGGSNTYYTREEIEEKPIDAPVLAWVDNPVESFILHIQGSGRIEMDNGEIMHVGYAANNGHKFVAISGLIAANGDRPKGSSMNEIKIWLEEHPIEAKKIMAQNPRYIFFRKINGEGPIGAQGVALTPERSIAVDRNHIPLGAPMWLDTYSPTGEGIRKLVMAQDVGAAIKGGIRADYFWGYGDLAFERAGKMKSKGRYFILLPKGVKL